MINHFGLKLVNNTLVTQNLNLRLFIYLLALYSLPLNFKRKGKEILNEYIYIYIYPLMLINMKVNVKKKKGYIKFDKGN